MASDEVRWAAEQWKEKHGYKAPWDRKQAVILEGLIKQLGIYFKRTWLAYLKDGSEFYRGHSPAKLKADPGRFLVVAENLELPLFPEKPKQPWEKAGMEKDEWRKTMENQIKIGEQETKALIARLSKKHQVIEQPKVKFDRKAAREAIAKLKEQL